MEIKPNPLASSCQETNDHLQLSQKASVPMQTVKKTIGQATIILMLGDITQQECDVIVNAANSTILGGGGVDGAIHHAAGPSLLVACKALRRAQAKRGEFVGCRTGGAVVTKAGKLQAKYVFHAVGPHGEDPQCDEDLASVYGKCMLLGEKLKVKTICFPSISTGIYGFPVQKAAPIAIKAVVKALQTAQSIQEVRFVFHPTYNPSDLLVYQEALENTLRDSRK